MRSGAVRCWRRPGGSGGGGQRRAGAAGVRAKRSTVQGLGTIGRSTLLHQPKTVTMATYVLIHGAGDSALYWHLLAPELRERGHVVLAIDLPCGDGSSGLSEFTEDVAQ